ncbi:urea amidolyase associated protein UAAP1 [Nocardia sp. NPDC052112]|uniref:urea amidolyase associated protein UAAP1 n=1 Tax=Nocardia sp. NPDC052112 TaxID=3155646 RepID=UPI0034277069
MTRTDSTTGARAHARSQAAAATIAGPELPDDVAAAKITFAQRIPAGGYANVVLGRGTRLRLRDPAGAACAHLLMLRADAPWERLNVADTVKVPWQAYLGTGHPLLSDQGRVLATIVADTSGRHDTLCGTTPEGRALLRLAGAKQGLTPRDIAPTVSFFRGVRVGSDGALSATGSAGAGASVDLLIHLPVVLLVADATHPLDERPVTDLDIIAWSAAEELAVPHNSDPEYVRAVENTEQAWTAATLEVGA